MKTYKMNPHKVGEHVIEGTAALTREARGPKEMDEWAITLRLGDKTVVFPYCTGVGHRRAVTSTGAFTSKRFPIGGQHTLWHYEHYRPCPPGVVDVLSCVVLDVRMYQEHREAEYPIDSLVREGMAEAGKGEELWGELQGGYRKLLALLRGSRGVCIDQLEESIPEDLR